MTTNRPEFKAHDDFIFEHKEVGKVTREEFIKYIRSSHDHMRKLSQIIQQYDQTIDDYLNEWDGRFESFDEDVKDLLHLWIQDGTMDHIINENLMSIKADKEYVDDLNENVTEQLAQTIDKLSESTGVSLTDFDRVIPEANDSGRFQRAIDYIESKSKVSEVDWAFAVTPTLLIPEGVFIADGMTLTKPINIVGVSPVSSIIKSTGSNRPVFTVRGHLREEASTGLEDVKTTFFRVGILGTAPNGYDNLFGGKPEQIGIKLDNSNRDYHETRIEVYYCNIRHMESHGIELGTSVSNKIISNNITLNTGDGIRAIGNYVTDSFIYFNSIRRNRIGINFSPSTGNTITTGWIVRNTIESNRNGYGVAGSSTRPAVGIHFQRAQYMYVFDNYFERHLNDIYILDNLSFSTFRNNYHDSSSNVLPNYEGYTPLVRQIAPIYFESGTNWSNTIEGNRLYRPQKPTNMSDELWGTSKWGEEYEHLPVMNGTSFTKILDNVSNVHLEAIEYKDNGTSTFEDYSRNTQNVWQKKTKNPIDIREATREIRDIATNHIIESNSTIPYVIPKQVFVYPSISTKEFKRMFSLQERKSDGTTSDIDDVFGINLEGELTIPVGKPLAYHFADGNYFIRHYSGQEMPTEGTYNRGDIVFNRYPTAGGFIGWTCVTAGSPGTWKGFGVIED